MRHQVLECYEDDLLLADGFDDAIIGIDFNDSRVIYSISRSIDILQSMGMDRIDAIEYFWYNVAGSYVGEHTPIWCDDSIVNNFQKQ